MLIVENNQAYIVDYNTRNKIGNPIKSKSKLIYIDSHEDHLYVTSEKATELYDINTSTGEIKQIISLKKNKMTSVYELILLENDILIYGTNKKEELVLIKVDPNGNLLYNKTFPSSNHKKSLQMPVIDNILYVYIEIQKNVDAVGLFDMGTGELKNTYSEYIEVKGQSRKNVGSYYVNKRNGAIYNIPKAEAKSPFDKKSRSYNSKGVIILKRF